MSAIISIVDDVVSGKKKNELMQWWLQTIQDKVDSFLPLHGFVDNSIPFDYINEPPENVEVVVKNLQVLEDLAKSGQTQMNFIQQITEEIYTKLNPFISEMEYVINVHKEQVCDEDVFSYHF